MSEWFILFYSGRIYRKIIVYIFYESPLNCYVLRVNKINTVRKEARETVWINMYILSQSVGIYVNECKSSASELLWKPGERERGSEKKQQHRELNSDSRGTRQCAWRWQCALIKVSCLQARCIHDHFTQPIYSLVTPHSTKLQKKSCYYRSC